MKKEMKSKRSMGQISLRKILVILFCIGFVLLGIGVGVSFIEYSSFEYLGKKEIGGDESTTKTLTEDLYRGVNGDGKVYIHSYWASENKVTIQTSKEIPKNQIQFIIEYNPNNVKDVVVNYEEMLANDPYYEGYYDAYYGDVEYSETNWSEETAEESPQKSYITYSVTPVSVQESGWEVFLRYKDEILNNIKKKQFYEYEYPEIKSVTVVVHPSNQKVVSIY